MELPERLAVIEEKAFQLDKLEVHLGQVWGNFWTTFSLGGEYIYPENDFGLPAGWNGRNTLRAGIKF